MTVTRTGSDVNSSSLTSVAYTIPADVEAP